MIGAWTINVGGKVYGPYTSERMRAFVGEGRLTPNSLLAREGTSDWHEAREEPEFADLFAPRAPAPALTDTQQTPAITPAAPAVDTEPKLAQFAIVVDLKSRSPGNLEQAISTLGTSHRLLPNVWIVSTTQTVN